MNGKQIIIIIIAVVISALIIWNDLPIEFPGMILKGLMLFVKVSVVVAVAIFGYIFTADKKKS